MALLSMKKGWVVAPIATLCALNAMFFTAPTSQANSTAVPQPSQLVAQSGCSTAALSRSSPPFQCVTPKVFSCLKRNNAGGGGSLEYRGDTSGEIVVKSNVVGPVALLGFNWSTANETLNLSVKKKSFGVQEQQIWDGFKNTLSKCR